MSFRPLFGALLLLTCLASHANANANATANATLEEAKRVAKQASTQYQLARFQEANDSYAKSYELVPTPGLLFNLGQCQMALESYARAIFFFEGYLRDKPDAPNAALVRDLIVEARKALVAQQAKKDEAAAAVLRAQEKAQPPVLPPPPPPPPRDRRRVPAVATGAASMALLGTSVVLGLRAGASGDAARLSASGPTQKSFESDKRNYTIGAGVTGGLALAGAVASGVLGWLGWQQPRTTVAVTPTSSGGAVSVSGSF